MIWGIYAYSDHHFTRVYYLCVSDSTARQHYDQWVPIIETDDIHELFELVTDIFIPFYNMGETPPIKMPKLGETPGVSAFPPETAGPKGQSTP